MSRQETKFQVRAIALACAALVTACGGGGGGDSSNGGIVQRVSFNYPGGSTVSIPPTTTTVKLVATAAGGGPITYTSNTPTTCTVSGDVLSLLKVGECSVTATAAAAKGYAAASVSQLFVIPKFPVKIKFPNPGHLVLDNNTVALTATSNAPGHAITFESTTPAVCTVSGSTLTKLDNGMCAVTATTVADDFAAAGLKTINIPIGTALPTALTFLSGYKDGDTTNEGGGIGHHGNWWWCDSCDKSTTSTDLSFTSQGTDPAKETFWIHAAGLKAGASDGIALNQGGDTLNGPQIDIQENLKFNLAVNPEWVATGNDGIKIDLVLGHFNLKGGNACNVTLTTTLKPTVAAATDYSLNLKDNFSISEACGLAGLDMWNELQSYPVSMIQFTQVAPMNGSKMVLSGPILFQ
ncbi:hypothetical protein NX784_00650 [Massilia pinisoli]|uniref:Ig-like domain-containing protein n=1 Tax=Massilia pinisoli TaxID=1772194 RepID=A0ABT1ZJL4_9BURK|nr:hypothetical protein [Massilia pinisoli]MCS0580091.1 hypothetical protein [Massilia pinisoli]